MNQSLEDLLPSRVPNFTPWLVELTYLKFLRMLLRVDRVPSDGYNLLFDIVCAMFDITRYPEEFNKAAQDALPPYLAMLVYRLHFSDLPTDELSSELALAVARALSLDSQWDDYAKEANSGVMLVAASSELDSKLKKQRGEKVHTSEDFSALRAALSLPPQAYPRIINAAAAEGEVVVDQILVSALAHCQDITDSPPSNEPTDLLKLLGDGRVAVRGGDGVVVIQLEFDPPLAAEVQHRAAVVSKMLKDNPTLAELVTALGVLQLREAEPKRNFFLSGSLAPVLIEMTPGFELLPEPCLGGLFFANLCFAVIPLTVQVPQEQGLRLGVVAASVLDVLSKDIMHCATRCGVWFFGEPLDLYTLFCANGPAGRVDEWIERARGQLPAFFEQLSGGLSITHQTTLVASNQFFLLWSWDELVAKRGADILKRGCLRQVCESQDWKFMVVQ